MKKSVRFSNNVAVIDIPFENRKGEWMRMALDRYRFKRRVDQMALIINPVLESRLIKIRNPPKVTFVKGDLLEMRNVDVIVQQCICLAVKSHGLSRDIARKFPWADIYRTRRSVTRRNLAVKEDRGVPGSIKILKSPGDGPHVACLLAQWDFGRSPKRVIPPHIDTKENRKTWFKNCLTELGKRDYCILAFPYKIGCGLAGGHWPTYLECIKRFAEEYQKDVLIVDHGL